MERKQTILEHLIYASIWLVVLIIPLFRQYQESNTDWNYILFYWKRVFPFLILFLINNYLLLPGLLIRKRSWLYLLFTALMIFLLFTAGPLIRHDGKLAPPRTKAVYPGKQSEPPAGFLPGSEPAFLGKPPTREEQKENQPVFRKKPEPLWQWPAGMGPMFGKWLIAILIIGFNTVIKFIFKSIRDEQKLKELEKHTLRTELDYLKAQINPHFFMNTLNNIHALIDLDTEKAKDTVIELSKLMRYVLYEADQTEVALWKEIDFLKHYIELMRIRYTEELDIHFSCPEILPEVQIPPLLLITFVENAFKHGVSYRSHSFVNIQLTINEQRLKLSVLNSLTSSSQNVQGVGLENVVKRLNILYKDNYTLHIDGKGEVYQVQLNIPLER